MADKPLYWTDQIAQELSKWNVDTHVVNDSKTPSGRIHIGALRGVLIHDAIFRSLRDAEIKSKIFYGWDDMDALDTVPSYLDVERFTPFIGFSLVNVPSPEDGFKNFAEFFTSEVIDIMKDTGCSAKNYRMSELYRKGEMNEAIRTALYNAEKVRQVFRDISGSDKGQEWLPLQMTCEKCGKIATTISTSFDGKKVHYRCESQVSWAKGCGHEGDASPFDGKAKLPWKVEWAARWKVLKVTVEGAGHDHYTKGGTRFVANELSERVFGYKHPYDLPYEWFYIGGKKMSSSKGIGASAKDMSMVTTPETLRFLMIKTRPQTTIDFDPDGKTLLRIFDEYNFHEAAYFGKEKVDDEKDLNNIKRSYELSQVSGTPKEPKLHVPSKIMMEIMKILPEKNRVDFVIKKLRDFGYTVKKSDEKDLELKTQIFERLYNYFEKGEEAPKPQLDDAQKSAIGDLITAIKSSKDSDDLQQKIFEIGKKSGLGLGNFFKTVYIVLLNSERGPKLGAYIYEVGRDEVIKKLMKALE